MVVVVAPIDGSFAVTGAVVAAGLGHCAWTWCAVLKNISTANKILKGLLIVEDWLKLLNGLENTFLIL
jgi:hypothetical protein